jgi:hypothetical protein
MRYAQCPKAYKYDCDRAFISMATNAERAGEQNQAHANC